MDETKKALLKLAKEMQIEIDHLSMTPAPRDEDSYRFERRLTEIHDRIVRVADGIKE